MHARRTSMQRGASCRTRVLPVRTIDLLVRAGAVHEASGRGFACRALAMSGKWLVGISAEPGGLDQLVDRHRTRVVDVAELLIVPGQPKGVRYALALSASEGAAGGEQSTNATVSPRAPAQRTRRPTGRPFRASRRPSARTAGSPAPARPRTHAPSPDRAASTGRPRPAAPSPSPIAGRRPRRARRS